MAGFIVITLLTPRGALGGSGEPPDAGKIYRQRCARCHGISGDGDGADAAIPALRPHSFRDCDWMALMSNATLFLAIAKGPESVGFNSGMHSYGATLSDAEISALVARIRRFCDRPGSATPEAQFPRPESTMVK